MNVYHTILRLTEDFIPYILSNQQNDPNRRDFGALVIPEKGFAEPGNTASAADALLSAYFCRDSRWHGDGALLDAAVAVLRFLNGVCHEDGSVDLRETNFHDCTSNGFIVQQLAYTYRLLEREAGTEKELEAKALIRSFLEKSARAMRTGGFHTPNHRWVLTSALSLCYNCLGDPACLELAETYLSEGIDCNGEGDYTERSVSIYDVVNNESLAIIAQELGMPELYRSVERNLEKNWYYMEPDFTGLTLASTRQDYGKEAQMIRHFYMYYQTALRTGSGKFAWMTNRLLEQMQKLRITLGTPNQIGASLNHQNLLTRFLLEPERELPAEEQPPLCYDRYFEKIGVARHREGDWTCSLLRDNSTFMKLQNRGLTVYAKLASSFFARGRLIAQELLPIEGGYRLTCEQEWGYTRPLPGIQQPDWSKIDHASREKANMQKHGWIVDVLFKKKGVSFRIQTKGTPEIPMKLEFILPVGGMLKAGGVTLPALPAGWAILEGGAVYDLGGDAIRLSGGFHEHDYTVTMRNSDPKPAELFSLYCTDFTPVDKTLDIEML